MKSIIENRVLTNLDFIVIYVIHKIYEIWLFKNYVCTGDYENNN